MKLSLLLLLVLALVLIAGSSAAPVFAATGTCVVTPNNAITGTTLTASCSGLLPNQLANVYFAEPDGKSTSGEIGDVLWASPDTPRADATGTIAFSIHTGIEKFATAQLGQWTVVATNPGSGLNSKGTFFLTGSGVGVSGANVTVLAVSQIVEIAFSTLSVKFSATGFMPGEVVNGWFTNPLSCSGNNFFGPDTGAHTVTAFSGQTFQPGGWKADGSGTISGSAVSIDAPPCTGTWRLTFRALGSGAGGSADFVWAGQSVDQAGGAALTITVPAFAIVGEPVVVHGTGFPSNTGVNCWASRPDGRALPFVSGRTDASGSFDLSDWLEPAEPGFASTEPGVWAMTCATTDRSALAIVRFTVNSLTIDP